MMAHDTKWNVQDNIWHFAVTDPELHAKGFTVYKVTCKTFPIRSPEALTEVVCWKRYNDFKILHKSLLALHKALHRRDQFPVFAKPKLFGRFDENVIEERRLSALELLNFVATQPHLYKSLVFKQFIEEGRTDTDFSPEPSLMQPKSSHRDPVAIEFSNPQQKQKSYVQHNVRREKSPTSGAKFQQGRKEQAAPQSGAQRNNNAELAVLEGTWNFPQVADNISLSSSTGDDFNDTDDDTSLATSFPDTDLAYFDPINVDPSKTETNEINEDIPLSNSWLLEGLNICAVMNSEVVNNYVQDDDETHTPICVKSSQDRTDSVLTSGSIASSSTLGKQSDVESPVTSNRKDSFGSGKTTPSKIADLDEFDPVKQASQSPDGAKGDCGRGDLDLSLEWQASVSVSSDVSSGSHGSQSSSIIHAQDKVHPEHVNKPPSAAPVRSQNAGSDRSQDSDKPSSSKSTPRSLLKRLVSGSPVTQKPQTLTEQNMASSDLNGKEDYIYLAANHISMAQNSEVSGEYDIAFAYYKSGVGILLQGVQGDTNQSRRDAVRRKTAQYLMKAEELFNRYLADENVDERRWGADSFFSPSLDLDPSFAFIRGSVRELRSFQVLGYIDKVVLVRDKVTDETFVIKSVPKSTPDVVRTQSILPTSCPHMVNLHKFFETDDSVFLLLQYASGGKLWTYIGDYLNSDRGLQANGDMNMNTVRTNVRNIYSGRKPEVASKSIALSSVASKSEDVLKEELDSSHVENELNSVDTSKDNVHSAETIDVMRFSALQRKSELYSADDIIQKSCHNKSFDTEGMVSPDSSESHDRFSDSDLNDVFKNAHKKQSLSQRFSNLSDDCGQANESETCVVSPSVDEDHFHLLLRENRGNLEAFSINSIDSEDTSRNSLSFHERTRSTSEHCEAISSPKHVTSRQISADEVFYLARKETLPANSKDKVRHASTDGVFSNNIPSRLVSVFNSEDFIRDSKELLKHAEEEGLVAETCDISEESDKISTVESSQSCALLEPHSYSDDIIQDTSNSDTNRSPEDITSDKSSRSLSSSSSEKLHFIPAENNKNLTTSVNDVAVTAIKTDVEAADSKDGAVQEESENPVTKKDSENSSLKHQTSAVASIASSCFRQTSTPRKLSINRMSSKDMTRSASFECDLKSPTRNRARAVSDLFERLDSTNKEQIQIPESSIKKWMAQLVTAISRLHSLGIICRDLKPSNILLGDGGQVYLTYFCSLGHGDPELDWDAVENLYAAPEVSSVGGYDRTCDWWSVGALLYELIVGRSLVECHPGGINSHTCLYVPTFVSSEARGLLEGLLNHNPNERLGSGMAGSEEIKAHPFFSGVDWHALEYS